MKNIRIYRKKKTIFFFEIIINAIEVSLQRHCVRTIVSNGIPSAKNTRTGVARMTKGRIQGAGSEPRLRFSAR